MKSIAIYGAGGFGKETKFLIDMINHASKQFNFQGFVDDNPELMYQKALLGDFQYLAIAIADPILRKKVYHICQRNFEYPNLIDPEVCIDPSVSKGEGLIICSGVKITVEVRLGDFVIINLNSTIGHDVKIGAFSSLMPSVNISGNVTIGEGVFIGTGATILQGLTIGDAAIIGAGAVVTKNVPGNSIAKGVPARFTNRKEA